MYLHLLICLGMLLASVGNALSIENGPAELALRVRDQLQQRLEGLPFRDAREQALLRLSRPLEHDATPARRAEAAMNACQYDEARVLIDSLLSAKTMTTDNLRAILKWRLLTENYAAVDSMTTLPSAAPALRTEQLLARAELKFRLLQYDEATALLDSISKIEVPSDALTSRTAYIFGRIYYKQNKASESLSTLLSAYTVDGLDADILHNTGLTLIKLGRANDAISVFEEAIRWNPLHEGAHYFLGNGYARLNYSQLADSAGPTLEQAAALVREASPLWALRNYDAAIAKYQQALALVPAYGRAHNGLARTLEGKRMLISINRRADEAVFDAKATPVIQGIETYVANWDSLTPRHQKQVALAIEPWKNYIPLLVECGSRHYIKPLHEKLSECPNLRSLKDQRISYDSRLWDDVRGCGGFTTVTGIEDVERSIYFSYNTVLHELTHQVHGCFPPDDSQALEAAFQAARLRDDGGTPTFMSRYQASSVAEYFAEGANAYYSPRRNEYDTREIVRERLLAMDTVLVKLVETYVAAPRLEQCWPVGLCNAANDAIEKPDLELALTLARKAQTRDTHAEVVLNTLSFLYSLRNEDSLAILYADSLIRLYPEQGRTYLLMSQVLHTAYPRREEERLEFLQHGLMGTDTSDRVRVFQAIGDVCNYNGKYDEAREAFNWILTRYPTDYSALWGLAVSFGTDQQADEFYARALTERTGVAGLRCDYARYLFAIGRDSAASAQLDEAVLLAPKDGIVLATQAVAALSERRWSEAMNLSEKALATAAAPRLAAVVKVIALKRMGKQREAEDLRAKLIKESKTVQPEWVYDPEISNFTVKAEWPADIVKLLNEK